MGGEKGGESFPQIPANKPAKTVLLCSRGFLGHNNKEKEGGIMPAHNHTKHFHRMRVCECDGVQTAHGGQQSPRRLEEHQKKCVRECCEAFQYYPRSHLYTSELLFFSICYLF